jgi:hypothetical protein
MTTDAATRPRRRRPRPYAVMGSAFALFLMLLTLLAWQLRSGQDPAIGAGPAIAQAPQSAPVVVRKVVKRVVVVRSVGEGDDGAPAGGSTQSTAAAAQPAPASAPAPLQTRSS